MIKIQFTIYQKEDKYKPVSTVIQVESAEEFRNNFNKYKIKAITNICAKRYWDSSDLKEYGYTKLKYRKVD